MIQWIAHDLGVSQVDDPYDLLPFGVCVIDRGLDVHGWNSTLSKWTGIDREYACDMNLATMYPEFLTSNLDARLNEVFEHGHNVVLSPTLHRNFIPIQLRTGDSKMVQKAQIRPVGNGSPFALVIIEDVTAAFEQSEKLRLERRELKKSEACLRESRDALQIAMDQADAANRSKSEFLSNMSHEIRTPMTAILGFADVLRQSSQNEEQILAIETIQRNGDHLLSILNDILDLSKVEAGKMTVEEIVFSPSEILMNVVGLMKVPADAKGLLLHADCDGWVPETIQSDPNRLRQILINLVGNAIKFTEFGSVRIKMKLLDSSTENPLLQFEVTDTGMGMDDEQISNIFKPFRQADTSTTRKFGGTGLGLAISHRMVELLGGHIGVTSIPGESSTFRLTIETRTGALDAIELTDPTVALAPSEKAELKTPMRLGSEQDNELDCRVLLAEDGPDNQRLVSYILKKAGAKVTVAENGQIAFEKAMEAVGNGNPFDAVLMDMQMPVLDGYSATTQLRKSGFKAPIIALTAHAMTADRKKCTDAGCDDYMTKPIDRHKLIEMLKLYTSSHRPTSNDSAVTSQVSSVMNQRQKV